MTIGHLLITSTPLNHLSQVAVVLAEAAEVVTPGKRLRVLDDEPTIGRGVQDEKKLWPGFFRRLSGGCVVSPEVMPSQPHIPHISPYF